MNEEVLTTPARRPDAVQLQGIRVALVPLNAREHAQCLYSEMRSRPDLWQYMSDSPPTDETSFEHDLAKKQQSQDPLCFTIIDNASKSSVGVASYLRIEPVHRVMEVGSILFSPRLQKTAAATEAMYLMAKYAFEDLGYRRYEWKCNALNGPSRRAALRLGFTFEGIFRQHMIVKGVNRDTAWFAMLDSEWPDRKQALESWLAAENFDSAGQQRQALASLRKA